MAELGFDDPVDPDQALNEVGLDSLRSVALSNKLERELGVPVSVAKLITGPTINQLVDYLIDELASVMVDRSLEARTVMMAETVPAPAGNPTVSAANVRLQAPSPAHPVFTTDERRIADDPDQDQEETQRVTGHKGPAAVMVTADDEAVNVGTDAAKCPLAEDNGPREDFGAPVARPVGDFAARTIGKWLIAPRPNPGAKTRLFCFPYAGGGLVSFRVWPQSLDDFVEVVAVEPPGRGTRINETAIDDLDTFVERLMPEMIEWLDRPSAFFGHCLGGLTMFASLCALPQASVRFVKHSFACGVRPPHLLKRMGEFEDNLAYDIMLHRDFDVRLPPLAQTDEIVADIIRQFDTPAADKMLEIPKLRKVLLPTVRAEFGMAYNYRYQPVEPFSFPISSFVGDADPWVSEEDSAGWGELTRGGFTNHVRKGSHFLMVDDQEYILTTISKELAKVVHQ
jgi:surfactin synthase thioesterase subunit/aryl carrier-like protein